MPFCDEGTSLSWGSRHRANLIKAISNCRRLAAFPVRYPNYCARPLEPASCHPTDVNVKYIYILTKERVAMAQVVQTLDDYGRPAWNFRGSHVASRLCFDA